MRWFFSMMFGLAFFAGCENTDLNTAVDAGLDAMKAVTLSDADVQRIAAQSARYSDAKHVLAGPENRYGKRLDGLIGRHLQRDGVSFNYGVYLSADVNAFAMADGTIRIYSGLMDMLKDGELRFVIGHEMGHVVQNHIRKQIRLAYAASAVRKGIASQYGVAGELARSVIGDLAETLLKAQFSQIEEKEADDYGLSFLRGEAYDPKDAVSALKKIAALGSTHSFLSTHPDPDVRAERLIAQLEGRALSIAENKQHLMDRLKVFISTYLISFFKRE